MPTSWRTPGRRSPCSSASASSSGAVRVKWHSLAASALVHACYNGTIFALIFVATSGFRHLDKLKQ